MSNSLHPLRWLAYGLAGLPVLLLVISAIAWLTQQADPSRAAFRWFKIVVAAEVIAVIALAITGMVYEKISAARARELYPMPGRLIEVGGHRMHIDCAGQGSPTVVLIYGMSGSYLDWYWVQPEIAKFTRVCSYDRPGYGWSDSNSGLPLPGISAEELHTLLTNAGEKAPFVLVGHSLGGFEVRAFANKYPDETAGAVLVDAAHPDWNIPFTRRDRLSLRFLQFTAPFGLPRWRRWCLQGPPAIAERKAGFNCESRVFKANYDLWDAYAQSAGEAKAFPGMGGLPLVVISRDPNRAGVRNPAAEQRWARLQDHLALLSRDSKHIIAEGSGHGVPLERPDIVVEEIRKLVEQVRRPT